MQSSNVQSRLEIPVSPSYYVGQKPSFARPKIVGHFSVNGKQEYSSDASQLKYVFFKERKMKVKFDLNHMSDQTVKKIESKETWEKLSGIFCWVGLHGPLLFTSNNITFVTYRGNLSKIMRSPYETQEDWTLCARIYDGVIYITHFETEKERIRQSTASEHEKRCQSWGFKFEQFVLTDKHGKKPNIDEILNENEEFCCMFQTKLEHHQLVYGAEMDGIISESDIDVCKDLPTATFAELKTNRAFQNERQYKSFCRFKLLKWWVQCYLAGISTVICGFRDDNGIVHTLEQFTVRDFTKMAVGWDPNVSLSFCVKFLDFVKKVVLENCENNKDNNDVWKFDCFPNQKVTATKISGISKYTDGFQQIKISQVLTI